VILNTATGDVDISNITGGICRSQESSSFSYVLEETTYSCRGPLQIIDTEEACIEAAAAMDGYSWI
jgi:hypothetical protein